MAKPFGHTQHVGYISDLGFWNKSGLDSNKNPVLRMKIKNHKFLFTQFRVPYKIQACHITASAYSS